MGDPALNSIGDLLGGAFALNQAAFQQITRLPNGQTIALLVVFFAGLSLAVGQSIILFINQVKPIRFVFSLFLNAVLFAFGYLFLVLTTWLIGWLPGFYLFSWDALVRVLGLSYAPLLFSFLGAMPYAGVPILNVLSVWHLLAMVVGISAITKLSLADSLIYIAFGWVVLQILKGSVGQPIAKLGNRLTKRVAGVDVVRRRSQLKELVQSGLETRMTGAGAMATAPAHPPQTTAGSSGPAPEPANVSLNVVPSSAGVAALPISTSDFDSLGVQIEHRVQRIPQVVRLGLLLLGMVLLFIVVALLLRPVRDTLFGWRQSLPLLVRWVFDLTWIGIVALVFSGLLAPLEALGWWAGWFGDEVDTHGVAPSGEPYGIATMEALPLTQAEQENRPARYVVYLDGVGQSGDEYTPDVVDFLNALEPALPQDVKLVKGLMLYSMGNRSLREGRPLAWLWRRADAVRWVNPMAVLGLFVNIRNAWAVAVSADKRYGPLYNQNIAQVVYDGLIRHGYQPGDGTPITLIGYSGGGHMSAAIAPYLKRVLGADIEVISLGGVMSANMNFLKLEHLYHLTGSKDWVTALGPILFPGRRKWFPLSYWNRAMRKGKISLIDLGPMGHQVPGGIMDPKALLPSGETHLQHTINTILAILEGHLAAPPAHLSPRTSNYELYKQAPFNNYTYYPLNQGVDPQWYRPIGSWMGRLILPQLAERRQLRGVWFEVHHAPIGYEALVGQRVMLRWADNPIVKQQVKAVTHDVYFSVDAQYSSQYGGTIHPERLNHWQRVGPLESLAGSHPTDDLIVMLNGSVDVQSGILWQAVESVDRGASSPAPGQSLTALYIQQQPVEITGRYYALVRFEAPIEGTDRFRVTHFNALSRDFDGATEEVRLPQVVIAQGYGSYPSTSHQIERSPLNETGWYIYGAKDAEGYFVVQSLGPRALFRLQPERVIFGSKASYRYIRQEAWAKAAEQKGRISSVLCVGHRQTDSNQAAIDDWKVGDRALVLHVYGGIGGRNKEPAAATPIFFGHFAYGLATVVHDPLSDERRFDIRYYQVYTHNTDGLIAGTLHWSRYMGDRQFGWLGARPVCDILVKFEPFTGELIDINGQRRSPLNGTIRQLEAMTARYRIGNGTGATYVGPANNCSQDSNQALFASLRSIAQTVEANQPTVQAWLQNNPEQAERYHQLLEINHQLIRKLQPLGALRTDWEANEFNLGTTLEDEPLRNLLTGLGSWRTLLPRKASDVIVQVFLDHGASAWVLRTNQVGGYDPDIEPIAPMTL